MSLPSAQIHDSMLSFVGRDQYNIHVYPQDRERGPASPFNDSPMGRLSVHFTGRGKEVDFLQNALSKAQNGVPSCCAVYGMPGVGKSQLILHYAKLSFDQGQYSYIFWISATTTDKLNDGLAKILDLVRHPDRYLQDQTAKLTAARLWLEQVQDKWLLIFDNIDSSSMEFFETHLPRRNVQGNILFTTRTKDVAEALAIMGGNDQSICQLHPLELRDSANLLLQDAGVDMETATPSLLSLAEQVVECIGRLPLAVVQAASFMRKTDTTLDEMYNFYMGDEKIDVVEWENDLNQYQERSVATTFTKQFNELQIESVDASNLFKLLSFLDPENIPVTMITKAAKEWLHPQYPPKDTPSQPEPDSDISLEFRSLVTMICSTAKFRTALQKLQSLSLVEYRSTERNSSLWIHDLIRFVRREGAKKENSYQEWLQASVSLVCGAFRQIEDPTSPKRWAECEEFMPHLRSLSRWSNEYGTNLELVDANGRIVRYLDSRGRYGDAELLLKQVLEAYEMKSGCEHPSTLTSVNNLAFVYESQGRYGEAETLHKRALAGSEEHLGADHPDTFTSVNNLASVYQSQGQYDEAETLYKRALAGREEYLGPDHPDTLMSVNNLASVYNSQGRYDEAETLYKRALAGCEEHLGPDHPDTLMSVGNLAGVYKSKGQYDEAETLCKQALAGSEEHLGADHPSTLTSVNNLAFVYGSQGRYDEAETLYKRAIAGCEEHLGADHPDTLMSVHNLAGVYKLQGRYDEAETLCKQALDGSEEHLGADHPSTLTSVNNLADVYKSQSRYDEAESLFKRAAASYEGRLGADHPSTLKSVTNLGIVYKSQRRYEEAETLHKRALAGYEEHLGDNHLSTLTSANNLANVYQSLKRYDEAQALFERALAGFEEHLGADHPSTLALVHNLAGVYEAQTRYDDAETLFKRALAGKQEHLGADDLSTLMSVNGLAGVYESQKRYDEAEPLYKRAAAGFEKTLGAQHPNTRIASRNLARIYYLQGRHAESESIIQRYPHQASQDA